MRSQPRREGDREKMGKVKEVLLAWCAANWDVAVSAIKRIASRSVGKQGLFLSLSLLRARDIRTVSRNELHTAAALCKIDRLASKIPHRCALCSSLFSHACTLPLWSSAPLARSSSFHFSLAVQFARIIIKPRSLLCKDFLTLKRFCPLFVIIHPSCKKFTVKTGISHVKVFKIYCSFSKKFIL